MCICLELKLSNAKIFILIDDITLTGGTERVASFLANELTKAGKEVEIVSLTSSKNKPAFELLDKVKVSYINSSSIVKLGAFLKENPCSKIISISMGRLSFKVSVLHKALKLRSDLILSEHISFERSSTLVRFLKRISYRWADHLVLLTQHDFNLLYSNKKTQCSVIRNASSFPEVDNKVIHAKQKIVLAVGRLTYQKDFHRLLDIWASINNSMGWQLRIVGDGEEHMSLQRKIEEYQISNSVTLVPATKNITKEYALASILVMTSRFEGLPLALIEAKSFALPAVAFDCPTGPKELISNDIDGFLIPVNDNDLFKNKLLELMSETSTLKRMQSASLYSSRSYSEQAIIGKWLDLLNS